MVEINLSEVEKKPQSRKRKTSVSVEKLRQDRKTSVRVEKRQSG